MMRGRRSLVSSASGANTLLAIIIVVVLLASTIGAFLFVTGDTSASNTEVRIGSKVKVDYIGMLPDGRVFDTSLYSVATDNASYPKSPLFTFRSGTSTYSPLEFTVGGDTLIKGFEYGILGLKAGDKKTLTIPPSLGYGEQDPSKLVTIDLIETVQVYQYMTVAEFKAAYGKSPVTNDFLQDPKYGWDVKVLVADTNSDTVQIWNMATDGGEYTAYALSSDASYGWKIQTDVDIDNNKITVHHQLAGSSAGVAKGYDSAGSAKFVVQSVDEDAGTAVLNKNSETAGVTLTFVITIVSVS